MRLNPFRRGEASLSLADVQDEVNRLLDRLWHGESSVGPFDGQEWAPPIDVHESDEAFIVRAELPGLDERDIEVSLVNEVLTLKGTKLPPPDQSASSRRVRSERRFGRFCRSIEVPGAADAGQIGAVCRRGVLEITLSKTPAARPRPIQVKIEE